MNYAEIIQKSWYLTQQQPKLKWFVFVPSFIGVIIFAIEIAWQLFLFLDEWGYVKIDFLEVILSVTGFVLQSGLIVWIIIFVLLALFFMYILPSWVEGVLIFSVKHLLFDPEQNIHMRQRMVQGFEVYFRIFETRALLGVFSPWTILLFSATLYRYYHETLFKVIWPFLLLFGIISLFVTLFTHFAEHFVVYEEAAVVEALRKSVTLVFLNIGSMMAVFLIMMLVNLRVMINVLLVIGVPLAVIWIFTYYSSSFVQVLTIIIAIILIALTSYLGAVLEIFSTAVWTHTYLFFKKQQAAIEHTQVGE
ncbi:MAG TPA: hypothetical protein VIT68_04875 [Candidatus Gracilibacteria bacterium]